MKPELLALRTVNQYRSRDIFTYLGLRYYLENRAARRDRWAEEVAADLRLGKSSTTYNLTYCFKEIGANGAIGHRELHIPGPNEALAEAALLRACAVAGSSFQSSDAVFSYKLPESTDPRGIFEPYYIGYAKRHSAIANACKTYPGSTVLYRDLRRFYPSISHSLANQAWEDACQTSGLDRKFKRLGDRILQDYRHVSTKSNKGIITGPMFSHLLANLVLRPLDDVMIGEFSGRYFRYVDDLVVIVKPNDANRTDAFIKELCGERGLEVNLTKGFEVSTDDWLVAEHDLSLPQGGPSWVSFVGGIKQLLVSNPVSHTNLEQLFKDNGIRIVPLDYSHAVTDRSWLERFVDLASKPWFRRKVAARTPLTITAEGLTLRALFMEKFLTACEQPVPQGGFHRKRWLQQLRYATARLIYLADPKHLQAISQALTKVSELTEYASIFDALSSKDVTRLLPFGGNVAQAAAQPLKALGDTIKCNIPVWIPAAVEALGVLLINGVPLNIQSAPSHDNPLWSFASWNNGAGDLTTNGNSYFRELACLHGAMDQSRHSETLATAFDPAENLVFDAYWLGRSSS
ncbi:hypothetical protein CfE428DRAFT_0550 [Chthoniobacter flavus Ellin428]|uniref:Reverse transcriptase domain-containing protein n=1 Tax=Chthoniobacter flavus Ellin428 TaxID=497964 RepID=B4CV37_9BACT|nr:RNA-directed DNA polymerase [Chthoniobacter flavus]EDY22425.1 hypothetical protein CfE428DRAFT_0550 [Chthoniobacter flavus Ellin428]TCO94565.1 hypothetical protein EV701_10232 [Chthoniobacter flavus]